MNQNKQNNDQFKNKYWQWSNKNKSNKNHKLLKKITNL
jgi:hypothetical protein